MAISILVVDDETHTRDGLKQALETIFGASSLAVETAVDGDEAWAKIQATAFDVVLTDVKMPGIDGMELLRRIRADFPQTEVVVITGHGTEQMGFEAARIGAYDFLTKPLDLDQLELRLRRLFEKLQLQQNFQNVKDRLQAKYGFSELLGNTPAMKKVFDLIEQIAPSRASVLITGESGTGKQLVAEAIHALSPRKDKEMIQVNCSALNPNLLESELFGHERGAFTGAVRQKKGRFELADGSSIFLDEIGELPPEIQVKLLRVLEEREFERVGGTQTINVDIRMITATNRNLEEMVQEGRFREDFYFRLKVVNIHMPPLRERKADIALLLEAFINQFCEENNKPLLKIPDEVMDRFKSYDWPGNVRQLRNLAEQIVVLNRTGVMTPDDLPTFLKPPAPDDRLTIPTGLPLADVEKMYILDTLNRCDGNRTHAAQQLGIGRRTLLRKLADYGVKD